MNLELRGVENAGDIDRERIVLRANADLDIGKYAIFKCRNTSTGVASGPVPRAYWFADRKIKTGDFVVLYTKEGSTSEKAGEQGTTSYFYYWGLREPQWDDRHTAALINTSNWQFRK
jgi:hypothetical protein